MTGDGNLTYSWDSRDRLSALSGGATASFTYDAMGRRSGKTVVGTGTSFAYDGLNAVQELAGGTPSANLLTGLGLDETFSRTDMTQGTRSFVTDALGSTLALTDGAGVVKTSYAYEPYGAVTASGEVSGNAAQYTGRENDGTGLYYYRARYYHPGFGRFVAEDPIGFAGGQNIYSYVNGNPIGYIDPDGTQITFGHGARHLPGSISQSAAESAITSYVIPILPYISPGAGFWGTVNVGGVNLTFRAYPLSCGKVNIGTYY
ncbi:RHS repeat-associated core domain-containing protein [Cupriavidus sp. WKF15]|uniref:RHS repeat-associated core domain-containing protein n=1 Tax=Cupriavidus sp. WKF15 TaxID=3032282 RepID=UPI0023E1FF1B|nr:RHS repeat-associated core domain-containing protein [Cupriavidus sp. WKF15]WER48604.1 RHS repeat-associated core domain-containing protein [Cupriavidus sp. WKF15]